MATNLDFSSSYLMGSDRRGMHSPNAAPNCRRALCLTVLGFATGATGWRVLPQQRIGHPPWEHAAQRTFLAAPVARRASSLQRCRLQHTNCMGLSATPSENFQDSNSTPNSSDEGSYAVVNTTTVNQQARPFPRVGDIVQYGGKWRDDLSFGEVRQLQRVGQTGQWRAYVLSLDEVGKGEYRRDKYRRSKAEDVATLRPVKAFYVRSINGFKVMMNAQTGEPRYISDGYELDGFELPKPKDPVKFAVELQSYRELKARLIIDTATFGVVGSLLTSLVFGLDEAVLVAMGAISAVGYIILLEKAADDIGSGKQDALTQLRGNSRFAMPVILIALVALKNYLSDPTSIGPLNLVSKNDFTAAMGGFVVSSRLPLVVRELRGAVTADELLGMLPGSLGQGRKMMGGLGGSDSISSSSIGEPKEDTNSVLMVSSPCVLDRSALVEAIMSENDRMEAPMWCTTRPLKRDSIEDGRFISLGQLKFEDVERRDGFVYTYQDEQGESYGLRLEDVLAIREKGKVCLIDADRSLVEKLLEVPELLIVGVWISVDSFDVLKRQARSALTKDGLPEDEEQLESDVRALLRQAVSDIDFAITSRAFDFTIITNSESENALDTLRRAVEFAATG